MLQIGIRNNPSIVKVIFWMGLFGGLAMMPFGFMVKSLGFSINIYGELIVIFIFGKVYPIAVLLQHMLISWSFAVPLFVGLRILRSKLPGGYLLAGAIYGAGIWFFFNSLLLPFVFSRQTPWQIGFHAVWPSLTAHIIYGLVAAFSYTKFNRRVDA